MNRLEREPEARIHPSAIVDPRAELGRGVIIGPYCVISGGVQVGDGCHLHHQVTIDGHTKVGPGCEFFPGAVIGMKPQDLKYRGEPTRLEIGTGNVFREWVTVHPGTAGGGGITRIGDHNHLLVGVHVAHDCQVGNHCILANQVQLAGHVKVEDYVTFGGQSGVHHFVTIGRHAMIGGLTRVTADIPPFMIFVAARTHGRVRFVNGVGLKRCGFTEEQIAALKGAWARLYSRRARLNGKPILPTAQEILAEDDLDENVRYLCEFIVRSAAHGRHGRYLESLRSDKVNAPRPDQA
ncbi:MAG TPA: acyl-ACP--UDP-N-acetylglucosamine O-acyltransferase [Phycisphaerae bacterium]|nr:acyl-ACP--UDP-N-acetylglucosamine O-acyltransferase [Phycisphaerae bacterium]